MKINCQSENEVFLTFAQSNVIFQLTAGHIQPFFFPETFLMSSSPLTSWFHNIPDLVISQHSNDFSEHPVSESCMCSRFCLCFICSSPPLSQVSDKNYNKGHHLWKHEMHHKIPVTNICSTKILLETHNQQMF